MASTAGEMKSPQGGPVPGGNQEATADENAEADPKISRDDTFEILSNHRRRFALHHLQQNGAQADLGELAEHVAAWENDITVTEVSSDERKRVYTSLQQFHLPKMDEKGVVEFDDRAGTVELTAAAEDVDVYLEVVSGQDVPWSQYYLGLAAVNLGLLTVAAFDISPFGFLPDHSLGLFVATTFLVSALVHTYFSRTEMRLGDGDRPPEAEG